MAIVPDVSAIISQAFDDEEAAYAEAAIEAIVQNEAVVPTLFWYEIRNVLLMAERRKRITSSRTAAFLNDLAMLPFVIDDLPREAVVLELARRHTLTVYDAAYLELAQRRALPLATLDRALVTAAAAEDVVIFQAP